MNDVTTLRTHKKTKEELKEFKKHPREPYEEVLKRLMKEARKTDEKEEREKALDFFVEEMKEKHGDKVRKIILYGSYARGEASEESDLDVLIIWDGKPVNGRKYASGLAAEVMVDYGLLISPKVISQKKYEDMKKSGFPFVENIKREGIKIG